EFEPIHRVLFNLKDDILEKMRNFWDGEINLKQFTQAQEMIDEVDQQTGKSHKFGFISPSGFSVVEVKQPSTNLPVGTLQPFLDGFLRSGGAEKIGYVHGSEVTCCLGSTPGICSFYLPAMEKDQLFITVILDGAIPRKIFSMVESYEKRF